MSPSDPVGATLLSFFVGALTRVFFQQLDQADVDSGCTSDGQLCIHTVYLSGPMSSGKAEELAVSKLGLTLPVANCVAAPIVRAYRNLKGAVRTVNFSSDSQPGNHEGIEIIGLFFSSE